MLKGTINLLGDKSISHRVIILASSSNGISKLYNLSQAKDVQRTINSLSFSNFRIVSIEAIKNEKGINFVSIFGMVRAEYRR